MVSHLLSHMLLLMVLTGRAVVPVKALNDPIRCGYDNCCQAMAKLLTAFNELTADMHEIHDKQARDLEKFKGNISGSLASAAAVSTQLGKHSADLLNHDNRLKAHDALQADLYKLVQSFHRILSRPSDCSDIRERGSSVSGVYRVYLGSVDKRIEVDVYCDFGSVGQSWLVFQRRKDGSVDFYRNWNDYANGFGNLAGEFWLGNEKLSLFTMSKKYKLRIEMEDFAGVKRYAEYSTFSVKPSTDKYRLTVAGYSGNAGDCFTYHNNMMFSTKDADNDNYDRNCAVLHPGAWWFKSCIFSNLNGKYPVSSHVPFYAGIAWYHFSYSMKASEMKITAVM